MLADIDKFNLAFVKKLATFALRRSMTVSDREALADIAAESATRGYRLRELIEALVLSELFKER